VSADHGVDQPDAQFIEVAGPHLDHRAELGAQDEMDPSTDGPPAEQTPWPTARDA